MIYYLQEAIEPRAGRVVIFRGNILHKAAHSRLSTQSFIRVNISPC